MNSYLVAAFMVCLGILNVSNFEYPNHKRKLTRAQMGGIVFIGLILVMMAKIGLLWVFAFGVAGMYLLFPLYSKIF